MKTTEDQLSNTALKLGLISGLVIGLDRELCLELIKIKGYKYAKINKVILEFRDKFLKQLTGD